MARFNIGTNWNADHATEQALFGYVHQILSDAKEEVVVLRFPSELVRMSAAASVPGRSVISAGTLMYWATDVDAYRPLEAPDELSSGPLNGSTEGNDEMVAVIQDSFQGYSSHYSANPLLDPELVVAGYRDWAQSAVTSPSGSGFVLRRAGSAIGVATVRYSDEHKDVCEIELAGIATSEQRHGRYRFLLDAVVHGARERGCKRVVISTQSHNIRVQRAWASAGFRPVASVETMHSTRSTELPSVLNP